MIPNLHLFFLQLQWLLSFQQCCNFSQNKCCKTYLGTMLPPGGRHWQQNSPSFIPIATLILVFLHCKIITLLGFLKSSHRHIVNNLKFIYNGKVWWEKCLRQRQITDRPCTFLGHLGQHDTDRIITIKENQLPGGRMVPRHILQHC